MKFLKLISFILVISILSASIMACKAPISEETTSSSGNTTEAKEDNSTEVPSDEKKTEKPTEVTTEATTEKPTEAPTEEHLHYDRSPDYGSCVLCPG